MNRNPNPGLALDSPDVVHSEGDDNQPRQQHLHKALRHGMDICDEDICLMRRGINPTKHSGANRRVDTAWHGGQQPENKATMGTKRVVIEVTRRQ